MGDIWKKARPGQRLEIPAAAYNAWVDAARAERNRQHDVAQDAGPENRQTSIAKVQNTSGADLDRFAVLALGAPIITPTDNLQEFKNRPNFTGVVPADPAKCKTYCILLEPLKDAAIGRGIVAGITPVKINVVREDDRFADIEPGITANLRSVPYGSARILWKESGTGVKWAVVRLGDRPRFAIFELPSSAWQVGVPPDEPDGWAKLPGCRPVFYCADNYIYAADGSETPETVWHATGYPPDTQAAVTVLHKAEGVWPAKHGGGDRVWCHWHDQEGRWQILGPYEDHWRFVLAAPLARCGSAAAQLRLWKSGQWQVVDLSFVVYDAQGLASRDLLWAGPSPCGGNECHTASDALPAGTCGVAKYFADACKWEVLSLSPPGVALVRPTICHLPGHTTPVKVQVCTDGEWVDGADAQLQDADCQALVLATERIWAACVDYSPGASGCCGGGCYTYAPVKPFGLKRRVRIAEPIPHGSTGPGTILTPPEECDGTWEPASPTCEVTVCNLSFRRLCSDGHDTLLGSMPEIESEDVWAEVLPCSCNLTVLQAQRPTVLQGVLAEEMCPELTPADLTTMDVSGPWKWWDWPQGEWPVPESGDTITAVNPLGLVGCPEDVVLLHWNEDARVWAVMQVAPHSVDVATELTKDCDSTPPTLLLTKKRIWSLACGGGESCPAIVATDSIGFEAISLPIRVAWDCDSEEPGLKIIYADVYGLICPPEGGTIVTLPATSKTFVTGVSKSSCSVRYQTATVKGLWCEIATGDVLAFNGASVDVLTGLSFECDQATGTRKTLCVLSSDDGDDLEIEVPTVEIDAVTGFAQGDCSVTYTSQAIKAWGCAVGEAGGGDVFQGQQVANLIDVYWDGSGISGAVQTQCVLSAGTQTRVKLVEFYDCEDEDGDGSGSGPDPEIDVVVNSVDCETGAFEVGAAWPAEWAAALATLTIYDSLGNIVHGMDDSTPFAGDSSTTLGGRITGAPLSGTYTVTVNVYDGEGNLLGNNTVSFTCDERPLVVEVYGCGDDEARIHMVQLPPGVVSLHYAARDATGTIVAEGDCTPEIDGTCSIDLDMNVAQEYTWIITTEDADGNEATQTVVTCGEAES